jgi:hypothetical protein
MTVDRNTTSPSRQAFHSSVPDSPSPGAKRHRTVVIGMREPRPRDHVVGYLTILAETHLAEHPR